MRTTLAIWCVLGLAAGPALAQDEDPLDSLDESGSADTAVGADTTATGSATRMTLPEKQLYIGGYIPINLNEAFKPFSIAPDIWFGFNPDLTFGLTHSRHAADGFFGGPSAGICLQSEEDGCPDPINATGLQARYQLPADKVPVPLSVAAEGGLFVNTFDPFALSLKLGAVGKWEGGKLAAMVGLNVFIGLTSRSEDAGGVEVTTNGETINLPITVMYSVMPKLAVGGQTGLVLPLQNTGDTYAIPFALGGRYMVTPKIHAELILAFPLFISGVSDAMGEGVNLFDARVLTLGGGYIF